MDIYSNYRILLFRSVTTDERHTFTLYEISISAKIAHVKNHDCAHPHKKRHEVCTGQSFLDVNVEYNDIQYYLRYQSSGCQRQHGFAQTLGATRICRHLMLKHILLK